MAALLDFSYLDVQEALPLKLQKLGTQYGGWTTPVELLGPEAICYCVGAGEDISFDVALAEQVGCQVYIFDPTPRAIAHYQQLRNSVFAGQTMSVNNHPSETYQIEQANFTSNLHFLPYGIYSENATLKFFEPTDSNHVSHSIDNLQQTEKYFSATCKTLATIMKELNHDCLDLLKLDVEGAEGAVLDNMLAEGLRPKVLCVEFDEALQQRKFLSAYGRIRRLVRAGYDIVADDNWNVTFVHCAAGQRLLGRWRLWSMGLRAYRKAVRHRKTIRKAA